MVVSKKDQCWRLPCQQHLAGPPAAAAENQHQQEDDQLDPSCPISLASRFNATPRKKEYTFFRLGPRQISPRLTFPGNQLSVASLHRLRDT